MGHSHSIPLVFVAHTTIHSLVGFFLSLMEQVSYPVWGWSDSNENNLEVNQMLEQRSKLASNILGSLLGNCSLQGVIRLVLAFDSLLWESELGMVQTFQKRVQDNAHVCSQIEERQRMLKSRIDRLQIDFWTRWFNAHLCESGRNAFLRYRCSLSIRINLESMQFASVNLQSTGDMARVTFSDKDISIGDMFGTTTPPGYSLNSYGSWSENFEPNHPTNPHWNNDYYRNSGRLTGWNGIEHTNTLTEFIHLLWNMLPRELLYTRYTKRPLSERDDIAKKRAQGAPPTDVLTEDQWQIAREKHAVFEPMLLIIHLALLLKPALTLLKATTTS